MRPLFAIGIASLLWLAAPDLAWACERCFGAGSDAPAVRAVVASMLGLFLVLTFVFGGVFSFFNGANIRAEEIERERELESQIPPNPVIPPLTPTDTD